MTQVVIGFVLAGAVFFVFYLLTKRRGEDKKDDQPLLMVQNQLQEMRRILDTRIGESTEAIQKQFGESRKIICEVTEKLVKLDETNKQVVNFSEQLQDLQDILKNPKQRGILGEYYLETVLSNILPPNSFKMQYEFKDGVIVDAAIFVKDKIIPIDSKFSLENYNKLLETRDEAERKKIEAALRQDLKNRIDETSKYVKPEENTLDFAFMFIPSEAVYYDLLINKIGAINARDLVEYALADKKVIIVSPTSFLAYLQTVLQGLRAFQIEESAKEIKKRVGELGRHLGSYESFVKKLGGHLSATVSAYNSAYKELGKIDKDVFRITGETAGTEPMMLEKPEQEE